MIGVHVNIVRFVDEDFPGGSSNVNCSMHIGLHGKRGLWSRLNTLRIELLPVRWVSYF